MLNKSLLQGSVDEYKLMFASASPYPHLVVDDVCDPSILETTLSQLDRAERLNLRKSRDFIFAKNKFENSRFGLVSPEFQSLKTELLSDWFEQWLREVTGEKVTVDPGFHGGGLHLGGPGSFLDMHADFNYHPAKRNWFRNLNILLYLNKGWLEGWGGELRLSDNRRAGNDEVLIQPLFNRMVVMLSRDFTLHGYNTISFPKGRFRASIASYAYTIEQDEGVYRPTVWRPSSSNFAKVGLARYFHHAVALKNKIFGSRTGKN